MSLYLLLLGRQESPHHYIPSAQTSLAQPDLQLVGHSKHSFCTSQMFFMMPQSQQMLPDSAWNPVPRLTVLSLGSASVGALGQSSWAPRPDLYTKSQLHLFRNYNDPGNLHAYSRLHNQVTNPLPTPPHPDSHCHGMLTSGTCGGSSSGKATSPTPSRGQNTVRKGSLSLILWFWGWLLYAFPLLLNSSTHMLSLKSHLYCFAFLTLPI